MRRALDTGSGALASRSRVGYSLPGARCSTPPSPAVRVGSYRFRRVRICMPLTRDDNERLLEEHHPRLVRWFRPRVHDRDRCEDLAQRTWVEVWSRIATFEPARASFWTFTKIWAKH